MTGQCSLWPVKSPFWPGIVCWLAIIFGNGLATILFSSEMQLKLTKWQYTVCWPFKPQYPHTNSPNWSPYISLKNELREFVKRSRHFYLGDHFINSHNLSVDNVQILLGENWSWSLLGLEGLMRVFNKDWLMVSQSMYMCVLTAPSYDRASLRASRSSNST